MTRAKSPVLVLAIFMLLAASCGGGDSESTEPAAPASEPAPDLMSEVDEGDDGAAAPAPEPAPAAEVDVELAGVTVVEFEGGGHTRDPVSYSTAPGAGGDHSPAWQNCGFYTVEVPQEQAVHSLEHGAVWVAYSGDAPQAELDRLTALAGESTHLLVTPFDVDSTYVLTAWARQTSIDSIDDPLFQQFLDTYMGDGPTAPEPNVACHSAAGIPPTDPLTIP